MRALRLVRLSNAAHQARRDSSSPGARRLSLLADGSEPALPALPAALHRGRCRRESHALWRAAYCYAAGAHSSWRYASLSDFVPEGQVPNLEGRVELLLLLLLRGALRGFLLC